MSLKQFRKLYRLYLIIGGLLILVALVFSILFDWDFHVAMISVGGLLVVFNFILLSRWKCPTCRKGLPIGGVSRWGTLNGMAPDWAIKKCGHCDTEINVATPKERAFRDEYERQREEKIARRRARQGRIYDPAQERIRTRKRARIIIISSIAMIPLSLGLLFLTWHFFVADKAVAQPHNIDLVTVEVGVVVEFGGIDWRVLAVEDGRALLLSEYVLEQRAFSRGRYVFWETSDLRAYLNDAFYYRFAEEARTRIAETILVNNGNLWYHTDGEADTLDKIFVLSVDEVLQYFGDSGALRDGPSNDGRFDDAYSTTRMATRIATDTEANWWLRTSGRGVGQAAFISSGGLIGMRGDRGDNGAIGVRPALWLYLDV